MTAEGQIIDAGDERVSLVDEKNVLVKRLDEVEKNLQLFKQWEEFLQRMSRLDKYLQAPDQASDYAKYELAVAELSAAKDRLDYVRTHDSKVRKFVCFLGLIDTIPELEQQIVRHAWRVEQLCWKLKLTGNISLQQEYQILDDYLEDLMAKGFAPSVVATQIRAIELDKREIRDRLSKIEEQLKRKQMKKVRDFSPSAVQTKLAQIESFAPPQSSPRRQTLYSHLNCWKPLNRDLNSAQHAVVIVSPYLTVKRSKKFHETFERLSNRDVTVTVLTRPQEAQSEHMVDQSASVIESLRELGVEVILVPKIHQKIIVIDDKICWEGSMNWLSHRDTAEHIRRIEDVELVAEVKESLSVYLEPTEAQNVNQPILVRTNISKSSSGAGASLIHREYVNVSPDQIEALLYDCSCCEEGGTFGPIFSSHF